MSHKTYEKLVKPGDLTPHPDNPRVHPEDQIALLAENLKAHGVMRRPVVADDLQILAGHGVVAAALVAGLAEVPVTVVCDLTPEERLAYVAADNQLGELSGNDYSKLQGLVMKLIEANYSQMNLLGWTQAELSRMVKAASRTEKDPDATPPAPEEPVTKPGDVWCLGDHRLVCGDSTDEETVKGLLAGVKPNLMVTDPPYGVNYDPNWREASGLNDVERGSVKNDDRAEWTEAYALFPGDIAYVWHGGLHAGLVQANLKQAGFDVRAQIIWAKSRFAISRGNYHWQHEPCWYAVRRKSEWQGSRKESTLWQINVGDLDTGHGTQKPVECMQRPIEHNSSPGMAVYDPFMGSGTTLIACETTGRICFGVELDPAYVDVAVKRWEQFTGEKAVCNGQTLEEKAA